MFIFDEPTTGLHFYDIQKLLNSFNALIKKGNSIVCIEHQSGCREMCRLDHRFRS